MCSLRWLRSLALNYIIYIPDFQLYRPESVSLASLARQLRVRKKCDIIPNTTGVESANTTKMVPITGRVRSLHSKNNRPINLPKVITFSTDYK